jgi:hypothetical protein
LSYNIAHGHQKLVTAIASLVNPEATIHMRSRQGPYLGEGSVRNIHACHGGLGRLSACTVCRDARLGFYLGPHNPDLLVHVAFYDLTQVAGDPLFLYILDILLST